MGHYSDKSIEIEELSAAIQDELSSYQEDITERQKKAVDIVSKEADQAIKNHITFKQHSGDYVKAFRTAKTYEDKHRKIKTWYVKEPYYRLTHLLENGHALPQGGRSRAFPHIKYGEEIAERRMAELSEEAIKNAGR